MRDKTAFLTSGEAADRLGISPKALRLYEQRGLITPGRSRAGWRVYGPADMERAGEILALRRLGLGLGQISALLRAGTGRETILAEHHARLETQMRDLGTTLRAIEDRRITGSNVSEGKAQAAVSLTLPWPWAGEHFQLPELPPLSYITGPLGSGKTRLAMRLAEAIPAGLFLGLDRLDADGRPYANRLENDAELSRRCGPILRALAADGAVPSQALAALVAATESDVTPLVIDMVEQGLDHDTQLALSRHLRGRSHPARPLLLMTRSSSILDLALAESGETIIYCPANHSLPLIVKADPLCRGYEVVATCLATPEVRARTAGVVAAWAPQHGSPGNDSRETIS